MSPKPLSFRFHDPAHHGLVSENRLFRGLVLNLLNDGSADPIFTRVEYA